MSREEASFLFAGFLGWFLFGALGIRFLGKVFFWGVGTGSYLLFFGPFARLNILLLFVQLLVFILSLTLKK